MAKKSSAKPATKTATKSATKSPAKPAPKQAKKPAAKAAVKKAAKPAKASAKKGSGVPSGAAAVSTGSGASPVQIGQTLVKMFNAGQFKEIEEMYWSPQIVSCEGVGVGMEWRGLKAVEEKNAGWMADHVIHGASAEGPYVGSTGFAVKFRMDVETKSAGKRETMEEVGVYTVRDGKIVREEFMYLVPG